MELRRVFDRIPEKFDRYRPRYCRELFETLTGEAGLCPGKRALELGPGTGQATEPILRTGCDYTGVELGEHLSAFMRKKYGGCPNFHLICGDFLSVELPKDSFDLVYSAASIQWMGEEAFARAHAVLRPGGLLAMFMTRSDEQSADPALYDRIQEVYTKYFRVEQPYSQKLDYRAALNYGFTELRVREWTQERRMSAEEYIAYIGTHCEHITLEEPWRAKFFDGIRDAVAAAGGITIRDTIPLYLVRKRW